MESVMSKKKTNIESLMIVRRKWKWFFVRKPFVEQVAIFRLYVSSSQVDQGG
jgi:hypothetical protein